MDYYDNIVNASTGYTRQERVIHCHSKYKARLIAGKENTLEDFAKAISNLKNRIQEIEQTEEYQEHLNKISHVDVCAGETTLKIREERERKEYWSEHERKQLELSIVLEYYYRKRAEDREANKPWWKFW